MANQEHLDLLRQGRATWNMWRQEHPKLFPDLGGADLSHTDLSGVAFWRANLSRANLSKTNLSSANLWQADLSGADLTEANLIAARLGRADLWEVQLSDAKLSKADLIAANLSRANLGGADLSGADLSQANLSGADLSQTNLSGAIMWLTVLTGVDLSTVEGLTLVRHRGPSSIGIDTIYRSGGKIPESFLIGAGVSNTFLVYMHSLISQSLPYFTCFISHSTKDRRFCDRLYADLQANGVRCWYFPEDAKWGESVWGEIDRSINVYSGWRKE